MMNIQHTYNGLALLICCLLFSWTAKAQHTLTWDHVTNSTATASSIGHASLNGTAFSENTLLANTDGALDFVIDHVQAGYIGFTTFPFDKTSTVKHGFFLSNWGGNDIRTMEGGAMVYNALFYSVGDLLKVERIGSNLTYYHNGNAIKTVTVDPAEDLIIMFQSTAVPNGYSSMNTTFNTTFPLWDFGITDVSTSGGSDGQVSANLSGISGPFSYQWSNGPTTSSITGLSVGTYTASLTDPTTRVRTAGVGVGHPWTWNYLADADTIGNDSIITDTIYTLGTSTGGYQSTALAAQVLAPNEDGWIEYIPPDKNGHFAFGFYDQATEYKNKFANLEHAIEISDNGQLRYKVGNSTLLLSYYHPGDAIRLERVGSNIDLKVNGLTVKTVACDPAQMLVPAIVFFGINNYLTNLKTSSTNYYPVTQYTVTAVNGMGQGGAINLEMMEGKAPYTYSWPGLGETSQDVADLPAGTYEVQITDANQLTFSRSIGVGYEVEWTDFVYTELSPEGYLQRTHVNAGAGARSTNRLAPNTDGWVEYTIEDEQLGLAIGLAKGDIHSFGLYYHYNYSIQIQPFTFPSYTRFAQLSAQVGERQSLKRGDIVRIERVGSSIHYKVNGVTKHTTSVDPTEELFVVGNLIAGVGKYSLSEIQLSGVRTSMAKSLAVSYTTTPEIFGNDGSIQLSMDGGTGPFSILWEEEELFSSLAFDTLINYLDTLTEDSLLAALDFSLWNYDAYRSNLYRPIQSGLSSSHYAVKVVDANEESVEMDIYLGTILEYTSHTGADVTPTSFTQTAVDGWGNMKVEMDAQLATGNDGWVSFSIPTTTGVTSLGWTSTTATGDNYTDLLFGFYAENGTMKITESGTFAAESVTFEAGDQFVLKREGNTISYLHNGTVIKTGTDNHGIDFDLKGIGKTPGKTVDHIGFNYRVPEAVANVQNAACGFPQSARIDLPQLYVNNPEINYLWSNGATTKDVSGLAPGTYTVTLTDNTPPFTMNLVSSFTLANKIYWEEHINSASGQTQTNTLENTASVGNAWANSRNSTGFFNIQPIVHPAPPIWAELEVPGNTTPKYSGILSLRNIGSGLESVAAGVIRTPANSSLNIPSVLIMLAYIPNGANSVFPGIIHAGQRFRLSLDPATPLQCNATGGAIATQFNYAVDGNPVFPVSAVMNGNNIPTGCYDVKGYTGYANTELKKVTTSLPCEEISQYAKLKERPDAFYYKIVDGRVHFNYIEEYVDSDGLLSYVVYDDFHNDVTANTGSISPTNVAYGDNRFSLDVTGLGSGFYMLEVANEKNEKLFLRFKI